MNMHHDVGLAGRHEEGEEVLADSLDPREAAAVDEPRALGEAAIGRRGLVRAAAQPARVLCGDAMDAVALDHAR